MNRREVLQQVAWLMGSAVSAPAVLGMLNGCATKPDAAWQPVFLTDQQGALVAAVAEFMIPRTDTPGAEDVGIAAFIDVMLKDTYPQKDQARFIAGLEEIEALASNQHGLAFMRLPAAQRSALVQTTHDVAATAARSYIGATPLPRPFILMMKELTLLGYFTSQIGATQVVQYNPVPGAYRGCVALSEAGR